MLPRLYLITDRHAVPGGDLLAAVRAALEGGVRLVQLREKDLSIDDLEPLARRMRADTADVGALLLINASEARRVDLACAVGADGVHLTSTREVTVGDARARWGEAGGDRPRPYGSIVGVSTHDAGEARAADAAGADLVTFGPVFETPSKRGLGEPTGIDGLRRTASEARGACVYALGSIDAARIPRLAGAGVHGVATIRAILATSDPAAASRGMLEALATW